jgi:mercuric ion binding protein
MNRLHPVFFVSILLVFASPALAGPSEASARTIRMQVNGLVCAFCAHGIKKALSEIPDAGDVHVDLERKLVAVALNDGGDISDAELNRALTDAGYTVVEIARTDQSIDSIKAENSD